MTSQNLLIGDDNFISALEKKTRLRLILGSALGLRQDVTQHMQARRAIQLSTQCQGEMLMVVREQDTLAQSFDMEDLRVDVIDCRGDSVTAQVDTTQEFRSSPLYEPPEPQLRNIDIITSTDSLCKSSLKSVNNHLETLSVVGSGI